MYGIPARNATAFRTFPAGVTRSQKLFYGDPLTSAAECRNFAPKPTDPATPAMWARESKMQRTQSPATYITNPDAMVFASHSEGTGIVFAMGRYAYGCFETWLTPAKAREIAAALIASADHYDAETARLAAELQEVAA